MLSDFRAFLLKSNALALAIGVILGAALGTVVTSLVEDIIMPPIGKLIGGVDFSALAIDLGGGAAIRYGNFINAVVVFIIVAFVVWQLGKVFIRRRRRPRRRTARSASRRTPSPPRNAGPARARSDRSGESERPAGRRAVLVGRGRSRPASRSSRTGRG